jgi:RNA polymerase sigma factor (sigma-70 family)
MDYSLRVTVRNGRLLDAISAAGYDSQSDFARQNGLRPSDVNALVAMREAPVTSTGDLSESAKRVCEALCALPEDLWTEEQLYVKLPRNSVEFGVETDELRQLIESRDKKKLVSVMMDRARLSGRERQVLMLRFFAEKTLEECGDQFDVQRERVRQIEAKALRKIRAVVAGDRGLEKEAAAYLGG